MCLPLLLDTTVDIATPEGVELRLPVAGLAPRSLAWLIDALIKSVGLTAASVAIQFAGEFGVGLLLISMFAMLWFYNVLFEVFNGGATPGKRAVGLRVTNANGTPVGWTGSLIRNLIRFVDVLPGCYAFGCLAVLFSRRYQRLGDMAAGTIVVFDPKATFQRAARTAEPIPVRIPLSLEEQQAIVSYGERAVGLNEQRAEELAAILRPVFPDVTRDRLRGYAAWLSGGERRA